MFPSKESILLCPRKGLNSRKNLCCNSDLLVLVSFRPSVSWHIFPVDPDKTRDAEDDGWGPGKQSDRWSASLQPGQLKLVSAYHLKLENHTVSDSLGPRLDTSTQAFCHPNIET